MLPIRVKSHAEMIPWDSNCKKKQKQKMYHVPVSRLSEIIARLGMKNDQAWFQART